MTATNMCSNFGGKWDSPPLKAQTAILEGKISLYSELPFVNMGACIIQLQYFLLLFQVSRWLVQSTCSQCFNRWAT